MKQFYILVFICLSAISNAQTIKGFVYDAETTVKGARLINSTENTLNYSNDKGYFELKAKPSDTLLVFSYFHIQKIMVVTPEMFEDEIVIELKKITNQLDEIELVNQKNKTFDSINVQTTTAKQGQIAFKKRVFGSGQNYQPTLDVIGLIGAIGKLFKRKNKLPQIRLIEADDLLSLFESSSFFNENLLLQQLNIPKDYHYLYFEYCSAQNINYNLIAAKKDVELLDLLNTYSLEFLELLETYKKD